MKTRIGVSGSATEQSPNSSSALYDTTISQPKPCKLPRLRQKLQGSKAFRFSYINGRLAPSSAFMCLHRFSDAHFHQWFFGTTWVVFAKHT
jgi:hypothetical protein